MNPLALAVQGIGFAVALVAVQGIGPDTAKVVTPVSYNVTTTDRVDPRKWVKIDREDLLKESATTTIPSIVGEGSVETISATGSASVGIEPSRGIGRISKVAAAGQASISLSVPRTKSSFGQISAMGQHDIKDHEILAILLTLLES